MFRYILNILYLQLTIAMLLAVTGCNSSSREKADDRLLSEKELDKQKTYTSLDTALQEPLKVYKLDLSRQGLTKLPESIGKLKNLQRLYLSDNNISSLPVSLCSLKKLQELRLGHNTLKKLPACIVELENLELLNIGANHIAVLPEDIGKLKKLKALACFGNQLTELPNSIAYIDSLASLDVAYNQIQELPVSFKELKHLKSLDISENNIQYFDFSPADWPLMKYIDLFDSGLKDVQIAKVKWDFSKAEIINDNCTYNPDIKSLSLDVIRQNPDLSRYAWDSERTTAVIQYREADTIFFSIGGCVHYNFNADWYLAGDTTSLSDSTYWMEKALWLAKAVDDYYFKEAIPAHNYRLDSSLSIPGVKLAYDASPEEQDYPIEPFIFIIREGNATRINLSWYDI